MAQWRRLKAQAADADWLMFRLGDFYELFFEDAEAAAPVLGLQLTSRDQKTPMCGVPQHALDEYLGRAVRAGFRVAVAEQLQDPATTRGLVDRGIVRTVGASNYLPEDGAGAGPLAALALRRDGFGLGLVWVGEGRLAAMAHRGAGWERVLAREWERFSPAEAVANRAPPPGIVARVEADRWFGAADAAARLRERLGVPSLARFGIQDDPLAADALWAALRRAEAAEGRRLSHLTRIEAMSPSGLMRVDPRTVRQLDIVAPEGPQAAGSDLWSWINLTATPMGERLLLSWVRAPLADGQAIAERRAAVGRWRDHDGERREVRALLRRVGDIERRVARVGLALATPRDLVRLGAGLDQAPSLAALTRAVDGADAVDEPGEVAAVREVLSQIAPDAPAAWDTGGLIRPGTDPDLDQARDLAHDRRAALLGLESALREETGIRALKVRSHRVLGYFVEVPAAHASRVPAGWRRRQTLANAERFTLDRLQDLAAAIDAASSEWLERERQAAESVLALVRDALRALEGWAGAVARLDAVVALAEAAARHRLTAPSVGAAVHVRGVRHPVVAERVPSYVASDLDLSAPAKAAVITGPNMAGKSTFMRAVAQNAWLAQIGSFVAADRWEAPLFDGIFTRIGAEDDVAHGRSTFLVEMEDVAAVLEQATGSSLVVLDELGRGTATFDGMAIAWAVLEQLAGDRRAGAPWTLFATHYHELTQLEGPTVVNLAVDAVQREGRLVWLHEVHPGRASRSFGVAVAAMAGLPRSVLRRAERLLAQWERSGRPAPPAPEQLDWLDPDPRAAEWLSELDRLNVDALTPLEALGLLAEWQRRRGEEAP
jgi:DNA mismatch repair protein MutS